LLVEPGCLSKVFATLFLFPIREVFFGLLLKGIDFDFEFLFFVVELSELFFDVGSNFFPFDFFLKVGIFLFFDGFFLWLFGITSEKSIEEAHLRIEICKKYNIKCM
jgi:hypothetical protein